MHDRSERAVFYRIGQLERANRRMAAVIFLLGGVGLLTVILGMASPDSHILEAERIVIKDRAGKVRAAFGVMDSSGSPGLVLYDPEANANVVLNLGADQEPGLWLYNKDRLRGALTVKGDRSLLELFDKENHRRLVLGVYHDSKPGMELYDDKDNLRAAIGRTALDLKRANVSEQHLVAPVTLWDERGNLVWHAP